MTDLPRDKDGNLYQNGMGTKRVKNRLKQNVKRAAKSSVIKQSRDSTDKLTTKGVNTSFEPIPENEVRMLVQQIREGVNRKVAVRAMGR